MCDYCDCRTRPLLARLGRDHEHIMDVVGRLRTATEDEVRTDLARELRTMLDAHSRREERALYQELAWTGIPTEALAAEHAEVDAALHSATVGAVTAWTLVMAALERLAGHIYREEYDLFPAAHQALDDAAWDRIDAATR